ncbi:MAG: segregation/condensation protein A [Bacteroides sp.]|nr:segregation/condensation protein A [Bacillota bacterium]MCM1393927.1 segregation/condensation protein A [[Eubacterium] siraeum]MCM1455906.1 segregation/condensation protein A [Bacteroides sp.]
MATTDDVITAVQNTDENNISVLSESDSESSALPSAGLGVDFLVEKPKIVYKLSDYEGPIELLYELIKAAKIPIEDIFISDITSQYVQIIKDTPKEELDYDYAGDFISMAAELIYLKSVRTLPKDDEENDGDNGEDEHQQLINKIKQYALIREKSEKLRDIETINRFYRPPTYTDKDYRVALVNFSLPKLVEAFAKVLANADKHEREIIPKKVMKDRFSVHEQMQHISMMIAVRGEMKFTEIFEPDYDKSDIVTTFLAMLELLKYGRLRAVQEEVFGEIIISAVEGTDNLPIEFEEGDDGKY